MKIVIFIDGIFYFFWSYIFKAMKCCFYSTSKSKSLKLFLWVVLYGEWINMDDVVFL